MAKYKKIVYQGQLPIMPSSKIFLNVNHLTPGDYILNITQSDKVIKTVAFTVDEDSRPENK